MNQVDIIAGSRLHFGLLCGPPKSIWHYGGLGLMLDQPTWDIRVSVNRESNEDVLAVSESVAARATTLLSEFRKLSPELPAVRVATRHEVSGHSGLGSGTQLTLSLATAFTLLSGSPRPPSIDTLAQKLGRSQRSAIGTFGFDHGGFIVDEGRDTSSTIRRISFPDAWRLVLLTPTDCQGLSGNPEEDFFGSREFLSTEVIQDFDHLIRNRILPALAQENLPLFRDALATYGEMVGQYYAAAQGGVFSNAVIREVTGRLAKQGITGAVQSSWGPTVCIATASEDEATGIKEAVFDLVSESDLTVTIAKPLNSGATIRTTAPEDSVHRSFG